MLTLIMSGMILGGFILVLIGFFDRQHEATEAHMERRIHRITSTPLAHLGKDTDHVDRLFAQSEEQRAREARKTTFLPTLSRFAEGDNFLGRLENQLIQVRSPWRATELLAGSLMLAMVVFVIFLLLGQPILSFVFAPVALVLPSTYLKILRASFFRKFDDQLADTLLLMSNSLRAGFSFMQAMEMVAREAPSPIKDEFARVTQEISLGVPIAEALTGMSERVNSSDLNLVLIAVIIQREVGGALAQLLELIAAVIRERQRIKGEIRTLTAQGRLTGGIMGFLPVVVGFAINMVGKMSAPDDPVFIEPLLTTDMGHMMLAGAFVLQLIGFFIIMRIVDIKV
ncbi:secretion system protein [bacterium]|nr:MAG: secretion system protein [bacterium]